VKVLFLSIDFVYPPDRGLRVRSFSQLQVMASLDFVEEITLLSLTEAPVPGDRLRALEREVPKVVAVAPVVQPTHMRRSPRHLPRLLRLRAQGEPYLIAKCNVARMRALVEQHLRAKHYDVVYLGHLGMAAYLKRIRRLAPGARVVLEEHNVEWEIFERLAPTFRMPMRLVARLEARALKAYEGGAMRAVDATIAISRADADALGKLSGTAATVVPTYIAAGAARREQTSAPALVYAGLLAWQPNAQGLDWFCKDVWPIIRRLVPDATLTIAGPGLRKNADGSLAVPPNWSLPGITTVGYVNDLEEVYRTSVAMVAPVLGGSGVRMKLLEAMRAGMPTVTTTDGAAGLAVSDGREMFIADTADRFAEKLGLLLADANLRERVRQAGYEYMREHHSLRAAGKELRPALGMGTDDTHVVL
jgi:glycosyltransferase involved in cell wall biosynthesis